MNEAETAAYLSAIHQLLLAHFDEEELKTLCLSLGLTHDDLPANGRNGRSPQHRLAHRCYSSDGNGHGLHL